MVSWEEAMIDHGRGQEIWSRRRFLGAGLAAAAGAALFPRSGSGQTSGQDLEKIRPGFMGLSAEEQMNHLNAIEQKILDETWWGRQIQGVISMIPADDIIINGVSGGEGKIDIKRKKAIVTYPSSMTRYNWFENGIPIFAEVECHETTHCVSYKESRKISDELLTLSEIQANMFFNGYPYGFFEVTNKNGWKDKILKAVIRDLFTEERSPEVYNVLKKMDVEGIIDNHFDDILFLYCMLLDRGYEFYKAHEKISKVVGSTSDNFDKRNRIYPKLREAAERSRNMTLKNGIHAQQIEEEGIQKMVFDRVKSYKTGAKIAKEYLEKVFPGYNNYEQRTKNLEDAWRDYWNKKHTF
jgi:hypothetical protein